MTRAELAVWSDLYGISIRALQDRDLPRLQAMTEEGRALVLRPPLVKYNPKRSNACSKKINWPLTSHKEQ